MSSYTSSIFVVSLLKSWHYFGSSKKSYRFFLVCLYVYRVKWSLRDIARKCEDGWPNMASISAKVYILMKYYWNSKKLKVIRNILKKMEIWNCKNESTCIIQQSLVNAPGNRSIALNSLPDPFGKYMNCIIVIVFRIFHPNVYSNFSLL